MCQEQEGKSIFHISVMANSVNERGNRTSRVLAEDIAVVADGLESALFLAGKKFGESAFDAKSAQSTAIAPDETLMVHYHSY